MLGCATWLVLLGVAVLLIARSEKKAEERRKPEVEYVVMPEVRRAVYEGLDSLFGGRLDGWNAEIVDSPLTVTFYGHYGENPYAPIFKVGSTDLAIRNELADFIYDFVCFLSDTNVLNYVESVTIRTCSGDYAINALPEVGGLLAAEKMRIYSRFGNTDSLWAHNARLRGYKEYQRDTMPVMPEYMNAYYDWLVCYQGAEEIGRSEFRMRNTVPYSMEELYANAENSYRFIWDVPYGRPLDWMIDGEEEPIESKLEEKLVLVMALERAGAVFELWHDICGDMNDAWLGSVVSGQVGISPVYDVQFKANMYPGVDYEYYEREAAADTPFVAYSKSGELRTSERIVFRVWFKGEETKEMKRMGDSVR